MRGRFKEKQKLQSLKGECYEVVELLGSGAQGEVYRVVCEGHEFALKWYFSHIATKEHATNLKKIIQVGSPKAGRFLWPLQIVEVSGIPNYGYVMPLRSKKYKSIYDLMLRNADPSFFSLITSCIYLSDSFHQLHIRGLCYRDISFGNVFFDPDSGEVLICDNDNITNDGDEIGGVLGTPRFMAPEIVRGEEKPNINTDRYSLAVLLFYLLFISHPLEGRQEAKIHCLDYPAMVQLYGTDPVFIFDPINASNRPVKGIHDNALIFWDIYPQFLKDEFIKSFTSGLINPSNRTTDLAWLYIFSKLRDCIFLCNCGAENFYDIEKLRNGDGKSLQCWRCDKKLELPPRIKIGKEIIILNHNTFLYSHHIEKSKPYDFEVQIAEINQKPNEPIIWELRNLTKETWVVTFSDGTIKNVPPGRSFTIKNQIKVNFGNVEGEIRI